MKNKYTKYIENILGIIKQDSLFKEKINKSGILDYTLENLPTLNSYDACHKVITQIMEELKKLGDLHSKFKIYNPTLVKKYEDEDINEEPEVKIIDNCGYIKLTSFDGTDEKEIIKYSETLQKQINDISKQELSGYIVDLSENSGGNMDPMILGLGPLIERNPTAYFEFPDGTKHSWGYIKGSYYYNDDVIFKLENHTEVNSKLPVAVLISSKTASSAEMLTVSLLKENVKLFGETTKNRTTGNAVYKLEDKSKLVLSTSKLIDPEGNDYLSGIHPDIKTAEPLKEALKWLHSYK